MQHSFLTFFGLDENSIRFGIFLATFAVMGLLEWALPKRERSLPKSRRWLTNWGIVMLDGVLVRLVMPIVPIGVAVYAADQGWGLLNWLDVPGWLAFIIAFVVLDFAIWLQHLLSHIVPVLWRLHQVHHADRDFDVSTALRFPSAGNHFIAGLQIRLDHHIWLHRP